jgi:ubiquinone/menaquinone biosynthesis C-methylase UbiE
MARWFDNFPQRTALLSEIPRSFKTGVGISWADIERGGTSGRVHWMERLLRPWYEQVLVQSVLPELDGLLDDLRDGARAADVGCGSGVAIVTMAEAFPQSDFHGWEIAPLALDRC